MTMKKKEHARLAATKTVDGRQFLYCACGKRWGGPNADKKRRKHLKEVRDMIARAPAAHVQFWVAPPRSLSEQMRIEAEAIRANGYGR